MSVLAFLKPEGWLSVDGGPRCSQLRNLSG